MSKTVEISAVFSTISSRLDSFGRWSYECWSPKQLAAYGFYIMPGKEGDPIVCFSCRKEYHCRCSTKLITDRELLRMHSAECLWADMLRDIIGQPSSVITRLMNYSIVVQPLQQEPEIDSSLSPLRSSLLSSPLLTANTASCETTSDLSSSTSADNLHTRSDNTSPLCEHLHSISQNPISDQDMSVPTVAHFVIEFSLSGLPAHSKFLLSVEDEQISAQIRYDYCVNDEARLDERAHETN